MERKETTVFLQRHEDVAAVTAAPAVGSLRSRLAPPLALPACEAGRRRGTHYGRGPHLRPGYTSLDSCWLFASSPLLLSGLQDRRSCHAPCVHSGLVTVEPMIFHFYVQRPSGPSSSTTEIQRQALVAPPLRPPPVDCHGVLRGAFHSSRVEPMGSLSQLGVCAKACWSIVDHLPRTALPCC